MSRLIAICLAAVAMLALAACNQSEKAAEDAAAKTPQVLPAPTNPTDKTAWKQYLVSAVTAHMEGVKTNHPYMYFVPSGDDQATKDDRQNQLDNVSGVIQRGVLPGNMIAFGGPDSKTTADLIVEAFKNASPGALKDVVVLFVGAAADQDAIKAAIAPSGAEFRFVEMK
ncbi:MAG: hypothetical protein U1F23_08355 [Lysobacterales bacterium]